MFTPEFFERTSRSHSFEDIVFVPTGRPSEETLEPFGEDILHAAIPRVPRAGFGYAILKDGPTEEAANVFNLWRLKGISQLAGLQKPSGQLFHHTRFTHSLVASAIAVLMALNNKLKKPAVRALKLAGDIHDALTIAYGDRLKGSDKLLDEDLQFPHLLKGAAQESFLGRYGVDQQLLIDIVQGRGLFAEIFAIADRLSYLANDVDAFLDQDSFFGSIYQEGYPDIQELVARRKYMFGLWSAVRVDDGKVFVEDADWLGDVLEIRALMFASVYFNPKSRPLGRLTSIFLAKHLLKTGVVSRKDLFQLTDADLDALIAGHFGSEAPRFIDPSGERPVIETFRTPEDGERRRRELLRMGAPIVLIDEQPPTNPATGTLVRSGQNILSFQKARPTRAAKIEAILAAAPTVRLFHFPGRRYEDLPLLLREVADISRETYLAETT